MSLLPVFMKLHGRPCLVVGAGEVATGKIESLVASGAAVTVVAPWAKPEIMHLAERGAITWHAREFLDTDLGEDIAGDRIGAAARPFIVIAGTDLAAVNQHVYRLCRAAGILCNAVDDIPHCDFYYGSVVSRGDLQIAVSTAGQSPSLAQRLRREIDAQLPHDLGPWLHTIGSLRQEVLAARPSDEERKLLLAGLATREACGAAACPSRHLVLPTALANEPAPKQAAPVSPPRNSAETRVWLVGAGPGDPDLLTVKAARLLTGADLVLHDDLVTGPILAMASATAEVINVGKRCGRAGVTQEQIHTLMIAGAREGRSVVRLKSGDPLLFGRAGEEMDALAAAGIPFEVVPGVTAASAAAAAMPCSLTDRRAASSILLSTGHHAVGSDTALEAQEPEPTRVVYMPGRDLSGIAREWRKAGLQGNYPCVLVSHAGQPDERVTRTTLSLLHVTDPGPAPALLMGGAVFATRSRQKAQTATPTTVSGYPEGASAPGEFR